MVELTCEELVKFETKIAKRFGDGELPYLVHFCGGNEDQLIDIFKSINPGDWVFSTHRNHYHYLLHGGSPDKLEQKILDGQSMFVFDRGLNFYSSSIVCATPSIATGVALALKRKNSAKKVWCFVGDGAADNGHLFEAARYVDAFNLPCIFVIENNDRSVSATLSDRWNNDVIHFPFKCVVEYKYKPTWPHGGTGVGWISFKTKAKIEEQFHDIKYEKRNCLSIPLHTYKDAVKESMNMLGEEGVIFVGYNTHYGSAYGTLNDVPLNQRVETPLAENLMAGLAIGLSLEGFKSCLYFERHDFIYNALDAIVNQVDKIRTISKNEFKIPMIIKTVVGGTKPFYAGITHTSDLTEIFKRLFHFPVLDAKTPEDVISMYDYAVDADCPVLIVERKELY